MSIDDLFREERLGFVHLDVEGSEAQVLRGARQVILRDQPVVTTEVTVHQSVASTQGLLRAIDALGYDAYLVEEVAGMRQDVRNLINLPRSRRSAFLGSHALDAATVAGRLFHVDHVSIFKYAFPCCKIGGDCCPKPGGMRVYCCSQWRVKDWLQKALQHGETDVSRFSRISWYDQGWYRWFPPDSDYTSWQSISRLRPLQNMSGMFHVKSSERNELAAQRKRATEQEKSERSSGKQAGAKRGGLGRISAAAES